MTRFEKARDIINIIVSIIVGVCSIAAAIFVGITANKIAISANEIAELQAMIAKNAEAPMFQIEYHSMYEEGYSRGNTIEVSVLDGIYSNYESDMVTFLSFSFSAWGENGWAVLDVVELPIYYFNSITHSYALYGQIEKRTATLSSEVELFRRECMNYYEDKIQISLGLDNLQISFVTYLKITYQNLLEENESIYYMINYDTYDALSTVVQINKNKGERKFDNFEKMRQNGLLPNTNPYIQPSTASDVFQMIDAVNAADDLYKDNFRDY